MLVVILLAMAMLGVLLVLTPRHGNDLPLANAAGRERYYSGQVVTEALAVRAAEPPERVVRRRHLDLTISEWIGAAARLREGASSDALFTAQSGGVIKAARRAVFFGKTLK